MTLAVDPDRLEMCQRHGAKVRAAIETMDLKALTRALTDPSIPRTEYRIGRRYRLAVLGSPPVTVERSIPEKGDSIHDAVSKLTGMDARATVAQVGLLELSVVYRGRAQSPGLPHVFRMTDGNDALLHDMDILAWERA